MAQRPGLTQKAKEEEPEASEALFYFSNCLFVSLHLKILFFREAILGF